MRKEPVPVSPDSQGVLGKLKLACRDASVGARPVQTVQHSCSVPVGVMEACRRAKQPFPDPHDWRPALADAKGPWWRCGRCGDVTRCKP